jgi:hypothetical protein
MHRIANPYSDQGAKLSPNYPQDGEQQSAAFKGIKQKACCTPGVWLDVQSGE